MTEIEALRLLLAAQQEGRLKAYAMADAPRWVTGIPRADPLEPGEEVEAVFCSLCDDDHPLISLDNEIGQCSRCQRRVQHRPSVQAGWPLFCLFCALTFIKGPDRGE